MIWLYISLVILFVILILVIIAIIRSNLHCVEPENHYTPHIYNDFPDKEDGNWLPQKKVHDYVYDENFHFRYNVTFKEKLYSGFVFFLSLFITPLLLVFDGAAIYKSQRKFKKLRKKYGKDGIISVSNHCYEYEVLMVHYLNYGREVYFPTWKEGIEGPSGNFYRAGGAIPMIKSFKGMMLSMKELESVLKEGKHLHVFPEAAGWFYYAGIRSFQDGAFRLAYNLNKPIVPIATSFRERKGIWRLFGPKNKPLVCMQVGEPIFPNKNNDKNEEIKRLVEESRNQVMQLAGIENEEMNNKIKQSYNYYPYDHSKSQF